MRRRKLEVRNDYQSESLQNKAALEYLKWRAIGTPAATVLLVSIGIFRGRGDTKTPLICTAIGSTNNFSD